MLRFDYHQMIIVILEVKKLKNKKKQKWTAILLLLAMIGTMLTGCGNKANTEISDVQETEHSLGKNEEQSTEEMGSNAAMGRYVENVIDLSDTLSGQKQSICKLADGRLAITDTYTGRFISKDGGLTWTKDTLSWHDEMVAAETYIMDIKTDAEGNSYVIYDVTDPAEKIEEGNYEMETALAIYKADGTKIPVDITLTEEDIYMTNIWISDRNRVFVSVIGSGNIYEIKEDGSSEKFLTMDEKAHLIQFHGKYMIMDSWRYESPQIYNLETKQFVEDDVLTEFMQENYKNRDYNGYTFDVYFFPGEEDVLYFAGEKGLYRHVIGGTVIEQVIDGTLCSFSNPAYGLIDMVMLENNEFLTLFGGGRLIRYVYDADIPTVPDEKLKVYSLKENDTIKQAISLYQSANPEVFVEYEVGMEDGSSVTREDALKSLNTQIMAGDGPDFLVLDGMPIDSFIEKGMLLDLSETLDSLSGEAALFENMVNAFRTKEGIYMIPCEIQLPLFLGKEKYISQMQDLEGIATAIEEMRKDYPGKDLLGVTTPKGIMRKLAVVCAPSWKMEDGKINLEAISEFLVQTKRIYDAQLESLPQEIIDTYQEMNERFLQDYGTSMDDSEFLRSNLDELGYIGGLNQLVWGTMTNSYKYASMISVDRISGFEDSKWTPMNGQSSQVFTTNTLVGISAGSNQQAQATEFLKVLLGKENQSSLFFGSPINRAGFEEECTIDESELDEEGVCSYLSMGNMDGLFISMKIYWPDEEQIKEIREWMESVTTPYVEDIVMETAVYEEGAAYLQGSKGLEETLDAIEKKVSLYMAE